ncbi:MAG: hypothetical protein AB1758_05430, partial [Candidatus Eremiobacterota bacterium]
ARADDGEVRHNLISPDRTTLTVADASGQPLFNYRSPDYVQQVQFDPVRGHSYVRTSAGIVALDREGNEVGSVMPERLNCLGSMKLLSTGELAVAIPLETFKDGQVLVLNPDLSPKWQHTSKLATDCLLDVGNGHVAAYDDGEGLEVLDAGGCVRCQTDHLKLYSPIVHEGRLMFLESQPSKYKQEYANVVRYDSATGEVDRFRVGSEAERIVPLPGGGFLLDEGPAAHPHITAYDRDGRRIGSYKFPDDTYPRQLHLSNDGKTALLVADGDGHGGGSRLYRLDLTPGRRGLLAALKGSSRPQPAYTRQGGFLPAMLPDGRLFVAHEGGVEELGPSGTPVKSYAGTREFLEEVGPDTPLGTTRYPLSYIAHDATEFTPARLDAWLESAHKRFKLSGGLMAVPPAPGSVFVTPDGCLNFALPAVSQLPASVALAVGGTQEALKRILTAQVLDRPEMAETSFPGQPGLKLRQTTEELQVVGPDGKSATVFSPENTGPYRLAVPLTVEGRPMVAGSTDDAKLVWYDPSKSSGSAQVFDLGGRVAQLGLSADGASVAATTEQGAFLLFTPPGQGVLQAPERLAPGPAQATGVSEGVSSVRVGGVIIRKRRAW